MMKQLIAGFPAQLTEALEIGRAAQLPQAPRPIHNVLICGMGGSGIGANLIQAFLVDELTVPVTVSKNYTIPAFVGENTLVIACSYSGGTEETLSGVAAAIAKGAFVVGITSGGKLGELLAENNFPHVAIPSRDKSPRAGLGYSFVQLLKVFAHFNLSAGDHFAEVEATRALLATEQEAINTEAMAMAAILKDCFPIFYGDTRLEPVLLRTQQQIAENSKQLSHQNVFPEMNHNELVGWVHPTWLWEKTVVVMLETTYDNPRNRMRMEICTPIFKERGARVERVAAKGNSFIEQATYLIHLLDWVSYYLAEENKEDAFPVAVIDFLKAELAKR
jgi:glucose/mannose-6-phosphate isomerase